MSSSPPPKRYLDPKIDFAFKRIFGGHANLFESPALFGWEAGN